VIPLQIIYEPSGEADISILDLPYIRKCPEEVFVNLTISFDERPK
jgi:hypothetical protein